MVCVENDNGGSNEIEWTMNDGFSAGQDGMVDHSVLMIYL